MSKTLRSYIPMPTLIHFFKRFRTMRGGQAFPPHLLHLRGRAGWVLALLLLGLMVLASPQPAAAQPPPQRLVTLTPPNPFSPRAAVGNVNGDAFPDLLILRPAIPGSFGDTPLLQLYVGGPSGLPSTPTRAVALPVRDPSTDGPPLGLSISNFPQPVLLADINGDGFDDAIVGMPQSKILTARGAGEVLIYRGMPAPPYLPDAATTQLLPSSSLEGGRFGWSVAVGDFNRDGRRDIIVGEPLVDPPGFLFGPGRVAIFRAPIGPGIIRPTQELSGSQNREQFGYVVAAANIVGGPEADAIIGSPFFTQVFTSQGKVQVFHSTPGGVSPSPNTTLMGRANGDYFGSYFAVGNVNGSGWAALAVGRRAVAAVLLFFSNGSTVNPNETRTVLIPEGAAGLPWQIALADVTGDQHADLVVGAPLARGGLGRVHVFRGTPTPPWLSEIWRIEPPSWLNFGSFLTVGNALGSVSNELVITSQQQIFVYGQPQPPCNPPSIPPGQPPDQTISSGQSATLSVTASGTPPLSYQWYRGSSGDTSNPIAGATASTYTTPALTSDASYWVRVSNACGSANSRTATVRVCTPPSIPPTQPSDQTISSGQSATLSVTPNGTQPLTYQWYRGSSGDTSNPIAGATASTYTTPPLTSDASYWVRVSNACGSANSRTATVRVCAYSISPTSASVGPEGGTVNVNVTASASSCPWTVLNPCSSWITVSPTSGTGSGTVTLTVSANPGPNQRSCTLTIAGRTLTVNQAAGVNFTLTANPSTVDAGGSLTVSWTAPSGRPATDWIALYRVGDPNTNYLWFEYTNGAASGSIPLSAPSQAGQYEFRYLLEAGYTDAARSNVVTVTPPQGNVSFQPSQDFAVGSDPFSVTVGDFNGDGIQDLATANVNSNTVSILLGNGDGTFQPARNLPVGSRPHSVTVGDFNGDGIQDLAVANNSSSTASILLGNGDGTFQPARDFPVGDFPVSIIVGDFNGDGVRDLAVTKPGSNTVAILLGNGDGSFQPASDYPVGNFPFLIIVGDFNGDGIQDLAVGNVNSNTVSILLGNGDGTFQPARNLPVVNAAYAVTVGDFNGDGIQDLAVAIVNSNTVAILLGNGDGTFQPARNLPVINSPYAVTVGDFNRDGIQDLAVANAAANSVSILLGNGDGSFQAARNFSVGSGPSSVTVGDFNGDARPDLATANRNSNSVSILINDTP